jgi:hypothetical protein
MPEEISVLSGLLPLFKVSLKGSVRDSKQANYMKFLLARLSRNRKV